MDTVPGKSLCVKKKQKKNIRATLQFNNKHVHQRLAQTEAMEGYVRI